MLYTLFFSRLRDLDPDERAAYQERAGSLKALAEDAHPGFVDLKTYTAEDGERLTVVRFRDEEAQRAWRRDPAHREGQRLGRERFYDQYRIVVCEPVRERAWTRD